MKRKYVRIFLMGLLCLIGNVELFSQYCLNMSYDKNGNRNYYKIYDCGKDMRDYANDIVEIDVCEKNETEMIVYPNPTNGKFIIENGDDMEYEMSLYDNKGVSPSIGKMGRKPWKRYLNRRFCMIFMASF